MAQLWRKTAVRLTRPDRAPADALQQCRKVDAGGRGGLRQQAGRGHTRERIDLKAPESSGRIAPEIDAAVGTEFQRAVGAQCVVLQLGGLGRRNLRRKQLPGAALLVLGLIVEDFSRGKNLPDRQRLLIENTHRELATGNE